MVVTPFYTTTCKNLHLGSSSLEKRKVEKTASLTKVLQSTQNDLDMANAELSTVESQRLEGIARIKAAEKRAEDLRSQIEFDKKSADEEIQSMISSFQKFETKYWAKREKWERLYMNGGVGLE